MHKVIRIFLISGFILISLIFFFFSYFSNSIEHLFLEDEVDFGCNIELPVESTYLRPENKFPFNDSLLKYPNLVLYNQSPGIYDFRFCYYFESSGVIYIKAFEVTANIQLSAQRLKSTSTINVDKKNKLSCYGPRKGIVIYEGNGECEYVARFEVWFKSNKQLFEKKLFEQNYLIRGWRR